MYIDTHAHLYLDPFNEDIQDVIDRAIRSGVTCMIMPNVDSDTIRPMLDLEQQYPDNLRSMIGLHPGSVKEDFERELEKVERELQRGGYVAVGEIGTDLYWDTTYRAQQELAFEQQIRWAKQYELPIVIHARESMDWTIDIVARNQDGSLKGVFHCFTGTASQARRIMELGFYMGMGGVLTYPKSGLKAVIAHIPPEHLLLETDAPYLPPVPHRGKRNESSYIPIVAAHLAEATGRTLEEIRDITTTQAQHLFGLKNAAG